MQIVLDGLGSPFVWEVQQGGLAAIQQAGDPLPAETLEDAVAAANSLPWAFQASIFTEDLRTAFYAAERLAASAVMVNDHTAFRTDWMPFAGRQPSGYGVGGILWTMKEMTTQKMIVFRTRAARR